MGDFFGNIFSRLQGLNPYPNTAAESILVSEDSRPSKSRFVESCS